MNSILFVAALAWYAQAAAPPDEVSDMARLSDWDIKKIFIDEICYAMKLYKTVARLEPSSFVLPTLDAFIGSLVLHLGANGKTKSEIFTALDLSDIRLYRHGMIEFLDVIKMAMKFQFKSDPRIIVKHGLVLSDDFIQAVSLFTNLKEQAVPEVDGTTIEQIFQSPPPDVFRNRLALCSEDLTFAVASKSSFALDMGTACSLQANFTDKNLKVSITEAFMHMVGNFKYGEAHIQLGGGDRNIPYKYIEFPSKTNGTIGMKTFIILPDNAGDFSDLEQSIEWIAIRDMTWNENTYRVDVKLPDFTTVQSSYDLAKPLAQYMNVEELFTEKADFSAMTSLRGIKLNSFVNNMLLYADVRFDMCDLEETLRVTPAEKTFHALHTFMMVTVMEEPYLSILSMARVNGLRM